MIKALWDNRSLIFIRAFRIGLIVFRVPWIRWFFIQDKSAQNVIWIRIRGVSDLAKAKSMRDIATIRALEKRGLPFYMFWGKDLSRFKNRVIWYHPNQNYGSLKSDNPTVRILKSLSTADESNQLRPPVNEIRIWENKGTMHELLDALGLPTPQTQIKSLRDLQNHCEFPIIVKEVHSCASKGVYIVNDFKDVEPTITALENKGIEKVLVQEKLEIKRDLRVVFVGEKIIRHHWRVPPEGVNSLTTHYAHKAIFDDFPEQWRARIQDWVRKLRLSYGAFDIAFPNDDIGQAPLILEVSPHFEANPAYRDTFANWPYKKYKQTLYFELDHWNLQEELQDEYVGYVLNTTNK